MIQDIGSAQFNNRFEDRRPEKFSNNDFHDICIRNGDTAIMELEPGEIRLSPMPKTWILDLDGTLVVHDGPFIMGRDEFLPGAREFLDSIPKRDMIIFLTARSDYEKPHTMRFLKENNVRYDHIIFNAGEGERNKEGSHSDPLMWDFQENPTWPGQAGNHYDQRYEAGRPYYRIFY